MFALERIFQSSQECSSHKSGEDKLFRGLESEERRLVVKLVGSSFPHKRALLDQLADAEITSVYDFLVYEFRVKSKYVIPTSGSLLGEGVFKDLDGTPVIISLLQKNGLLWRLDINKINSKPIMRFPDVENVKCLGFGQGVSFED